jgi:hypothetical protein
MSSEITLPAFELDCRDWLVARPEEAGLPDEVAGTPLVAVLSTAVVGRTDLQSVTAMLTLGLLDDDEPPGVAGTDSPTTQARPARLLDAEDGTVRYLIPTPDGRMALVAEFDHGPIVDPECDRRVRALMASFRWAA